MKRGKISESSKQDTIITSAFRRYGTNLDDMNDRKERLLRLSRDTTVGSKRVIFLLQRAYSEDQQQILQKAKTDVLTVRKSIEKIVDELEGHDYWQYHRLFSPGIQEYIEAVSFLEYIETGTLLTLEKAESDINDSNSKKAHFMLTVQDYLLGIADLTGELMRACVNAISLGEFEYCDKTSAFVRSIYNAFCSLPSQRNDVDKKMQTMYESLKKVENVCFNIKLRGEYPSALLSVDIEEF